MRYAGIIALFAFVPLTLVAWELLRHRRHRRHDDARRRRQRRVERDWFATRLFARSRTRRLTYDSPSHRFDRTRD